MAQDEENQIVSKMHVSLKYLKTSRSEEEQTEDTYVLEWIEPNHTSKMDKVHWSSSSEEEQSYAGWLIMFEMNWTINILNY